MQSFKILGMWTILKGFIECPIILFLINDLVFLATGIWDFSSLTND